MLLSQRVPHYTAGIPATTCRHIQCPYEDTIFKGGDFILSSEKAERCDPSRNSLSYKAVASLSEVFNSGRNHQKGKRGLGERLEERWHVTCFESLCREVRKRQLLLDPEDSILSWAPSMLFGQHIIADERRIPAYPGKFNVDSPYQFGLELWKATQLFDDRQAHGAHFMPKPPPHIPRPKVLIEGRDRQSLYLTNEAKDFSGRMPWGEIAEISAADVRGVTLGEMTRRVSAIVTPKYQARRELKKQEELARNAENASTEHDENRSGGRQSPEATEDQRDSGSEPTNLAQGAIISPTGANTLALSEEGTNISAVVKSTLDASTDDKKLPSTPKDGPTSSSTSPPTAASTADNIPNTIQNETTSHSSGPTPLPALPTEATPLNPPAPTAPEHPRTSLKRNRQSRGVETQTAATGPEMEADDENRADEDSEDDVVFVGRKKFAKGTIESSEGQGWGDERRGGRREGVAGGGGDR